MSCFVAAPAYLRCSDQVPPNPYGSDDEEDDYDSDEEAYRLEDVSSDVEIDADDFDDEDLEDDSQYVTMVFFSMFA